MCEVVLQRILQRIAARGDRDVQRRSDQKRSILATKYIGNGYVQQLGRSPTRSRYLSNAGLVPGELVAPLGRGQQGVIIHKKPESFTVAKQPQETIGIVYAFPIHSSYTQELTFLYGGILTVVSAGVNSIGTVSVYPAVQSIYGPSPLAFAQMEDVEIGETAGLLYVVNDKQFVGSSGTNAAYFVAGQSSFSKSLTVKVTVNDRNENKAGIGFQLLYTIRTYITNVGVYNNITWYAPPGGTSVILNFPVAGTVTFGGISGSGGGGVITLGLFSHTVPPFVSSVPNVSTIVAPGNYTFTVMPGYNGMAEDNEIYFLLYYESETFPLYDAWTDKPTSWYQSFDDGAGCQLVWDYDPIIYISEE